MGGQDPLSLNLRVSARIGRELLFGITSVTPRARYYSFLPWCFSYINTFSKNKSSVNELIPLIERYMVVACLLKHENTTCEEGALVGSKAALRWLEAIPAKRQRIEEVSFADNPAWKIYRASLLDLGLFDVTQEEYQDQQDETEVEEIEEVYLSWDEIQLSDLGKNIAQSYGMAVNNLTAVKNILTNSDNSTMRGLKEWGKRSCLCNLKEGQKHELESLRNLFFFKVSSPNETPCHEYRRDSLLLILGCIKKISRLKLSFYDSFKQMAYFGHVLDSNENAIRIKVSPALNDINLRWKMFYFHYYLSVALEVVFIQIVTECQKTGICGYEWKKLARQLYLRKVTREVSQYLNVDLEKNIGEYSLSEFLSLYGIDCEKIVGGKEQIEKFISIDHNLSEYWLDAISKEQFFKKPSGIAIALVYLLICLLRYMRWDNTEHGKWLAGECFRTNAPNKNVSVPVILNAFKYEYDEWWKVPIGELSKYIISKYVVNLHGMLSYDKSISGNNALFRREGEKLFWNNIEYEEISAGNPRLPSAVTILIDLGCISHQKDDKYTFCLTEDGSKILSEHLNRSV